MVLLRGSEQGIDERRPSSLLPGRAVFKPSLSGSLQTTDERIARLFVAPAAKRRGEAARRIDSTPWMSSLGGPTAAVPTTGRLPTGAPRESHARTASPSVCRVARRGSSCDVSSVRALGQVAGGGTAAMSDVVVVLPIDGFMPVARLVTGGLASSARLRLRDGRRPAACGRADSPLASRPERRGRAFLARRRALASGRDRTGRRSVARRRAAAARWCRRRPRSVARAAGRLGRADNRRRGRRRRPDEGPAGACLVKVAAPVSEVDRRSLLRAYREHGDLAARDRLVESFMPLVSSLARRYAGGGEQL